MSLVAKKIRIHGKVQGVAYRYSMCQAAKILELSGWVRNRKDGSVEAFVQGAKGAVDQILIWAQDGPPAAVVEKVEVEESETEKLQGFEQIATK